MCSTVMHSKDVGVQRIGLGVVQCVNAWQTWRPASRSLAPMWKLDILRYACNWNEVATHTTWRSKLWVKWETVSVRWRSNWGRHFKINLHVCPHGQAYSHIQVHRLNTILGLYFFLGTFFPFWLYLALLIDKRPGIQSYECRDLHDDKQLYKQPDCDWNSRTRTPNEGRLLWSTGSGSDFRELGQTSTYSEK